MEAFIEQAHGLYNFWIVIALMMAGLYAVMARGNLVKKAIGLNIFQSSVFLFYISMAKVQGGTAPILIDDAEAVYSNPLPHVLILTAIVVSVATTALGLSLIVRIQEAFGTIEDAELSAPGIGEETPEAAPLAGRPESVHR
ncbi:MAG TPA: cation:proton antiporter subunit C [Aestuariivirgaceae bacterium]|nr:cation:proton antiporter subunit C [Aestuariivirgaceae bacterium]